MTIGESIQKFCESSGHSEESVKNDPRVRRLWVESLGWDLDRSPEVMSVAADLLKEAWGKIAESSSQRRVMSDATLMSDVPVVSVAAVSPCPVCGVDMEVMPAFEVTHTPVGGVKEVLCKVCVRCFAAGVLWSSHRAALRSWNDAP